MYKGLGTLGEQVTESIGYAGQSEKEHAPGYDATSDFDPTQSYTEEDHIKEGYGSESGKSGYKNMDDKQKNEKEKESEFEQRVEKEAEKTKKDDTEEDVTKKIPRTMEEFAQKIDINKVRENFDKTKKSKEELVRKELEDAIKSEQIQRV